MSTPRSDAQVGVVDLGSGPVEGEVSKARDLDEERHGVVKGRDTKVRRRGSRRYEGESKIRRRVGESRRHKGESRKDNALIRVEDRDPAKGAGEPVLAERGVLALVRLVGLGEDADGGVHGLVGDDDGVVEEALGEGESVSDDFTKQKMCAGMVEGRVRREVRMFGVIWVRRGGK